MVSASEIQVLGKGHQGTQKQWRQWREQRKSIASEEVGRDGKSGGKKMVI